MTWNERAGRVTQAFDEWRLADRDIRSFQRLGRAFADEGYQSRWDAIAHQPSDGEGPDMFDLMDRETDGLTDIDFNWLLGNLCVRDGVTVYETYLEKGLEEVYQRQLGAYSVADRSPDARLLDRAYRVVLAIEPRPDPVREAIKLRDLLTHRRGELRTKALRERYDTEEYGLPDIKVSLPPDQVIGVLDDLAKSVRVVDLVLYRYAWGTDRLPERELEQLESLTAGWLRPER
jgi:hypothetical protein